MPTGQPPATPPDADCRTCQHYQVASWRGPCWAPKPCESGNSYTPSQPVRLWTRPMLRPVTRQA